MGTVVFSSKSKRKLDLLTQLAREFGVTIVKERDITDEEMAVPGNNPSPAQVEAWLAKGDGKSYSAEEAFTMIKASLAKSRAKKKNQSNSKLPA